MSKSMYKDCEIGSIPTNWNIQKLEELANVTGGKRLPKGSSLSEINNGHPYIRVSDMNDKGIQLDSMLYVPDDVVEQISRYRVDKDDLYISVAGTLGLVGKVPDELNGANLTENADRISNIRCNTDFLLYCLKSDFIKKIINSEMTTNAQPKLALTRIKQFPIPVPPLKEQQKIAEILSSVDAAIEKTEQVIAKTEEVKKGLMQQLLTKGIGHTEFKQTTIGEIPVEWEAIKAKDIFSNVSIKNNYNEELLSVTQENGVVPRKDLESRVTMPEGSVKSYKLVVPGDFIISLRSFQGGLELSKIRGIVSPAYTILQSQIEIDEEYFKYFFKSMGFINRLNSAVIGIRDGKQISYSVFSDLYFPIPPLNEQRRISNILNNIDKRLDIEKGYLNQQQQIKQGLMQQLLTGKTRVKID